MARDRTQDLLEEINQELETLQGLKTTLDERSRTEPWIELGQALSRRLEQGAELLEKAARESRITPRSKLAVKGCDRIQKGFQLTVGADDVWGLQEVDNALYVCQQAIAVPELHSENLEDSVAQVVFRMRDSLNIQARKAEKEQSEFSEARADRGQLASIEARIKACRQIDLSDSGTQVVERIRPWLGELAAMNRQHQQCEKFEKEELVEAYGDLIRLRYRVFEQIIRGPENLNALSSEEASELMSLYEQSEPSPSLVDARRARQAGMVGLKTRVQ